MVQKDKGGIYCEGIEKVGECPDGKIPTLSRANYEAWSLFKEMLPGFVNPMGGYDYNAIEVVFNAHGIEQDKRSVLLAQYVKVIEVIDKVRQEKQK